MKSRMWELQRNDSYADLENVSNDNEQSVLFPFIKTSTRDEGIKDEEVKSPVRPESQKSLEQNGHIR